MQLAWGLAVAVFGGTVGAANGFIRTKAPKALSGDKSKTVNLEIYYETLCPYCHALLDGSFRRIWGDKEFKERITVDLIPFGNAMVVPEDKISAGYHFFHPAAKYPVIICQHNEGECLGNEIHTCVHNTHGINKAVDLVLCMVEKQVKRQGVEKASYDCLMDLGIKPQTVKDCVGSPDNIQRMIGLGQRSMNKELNRSYVPWVMANNAHVELDDDSHDLITPLCGMLAEPLPKLCSEPVKPKNETEPTALAATRRSFAMKGSEEAKNFYSQMEEARRPQQRSLAEDMLSLM